MIQSMIVVALFKSQHDRRISEDTQTSMVEAFAKIGNSFQPSTAFAKKLYYRCLRGS